MCIDGDSNAWYCGLCRGRIGRSHQRARDRLYFFDRLFQNCCFGGERLDPAQQPPMKTDLELQQMRSVLRRFILYLLIITR